MTKIIQHKLKLIIISILYALNLADPSPAFESFGELKKQCQSFCHQAKNIKKSRQDKTSNFANADADRLNTGFSGDNLNDSQGPKFVRRKNTKVVYETISMPQPVYVDMSYKITIRAEYQQQMNELIQPFINRPSAINSVIIKKEEHTYEAFIKGDVATKNNISSMNSEERKYESEITINVLGYLQGEGANSRQPKFTIRENIVEFKFPREKVIMGDIPQHAGDGIARGTNKNSPEGNEYRE